jgi:putative hemolysin
MRVLSEEFLTVRGSHFRWVTVAPATVILRLDLPLRRARPLDDVAIPPLIKGYARLSAYVCGAPAWDPDFNTADLLLLLLPMSRMPPRHARYFRPRT